MICFELVLCIIAIRALGPHHRPLRGLRDKLGWWEPFVGLVGPPLGGLRDKHGSKMVGDDVVTPPRGTGPA